ncbi:50S ribosomal protein L30 [Buchnera aphidicola (Nipponaphis monzeni)]|uniref:Large ribosomal subunit protein uL30 n=1 Tax=Buchnera aphidicola (Nipponaphis monzeni) TaxID=2495405 RepID=A0A455TAN5_9GAMM|nr:50S ribosomal protein L30 [Buchnera aphidicola]BBI01383.1 50S ribosomal protein L30 [Buchnera aphidicola (Nipponaphis monzeni)]
MDKKYVHITQIKSSIGILPKHKLILSTLGLRKIGHTILKKDNIANRGMINHISYMLKVNKAQ